MERIDVILIWPNSNNRIQDAKLWHGNTNVIGVALDDEIKIEEAKEKAIGFTETSIKRYEKATQPFFAIAIHSQVSNGKFGFTANTKILCGDRYILEEPAERGVAKLDFQSVYEKLLSS